MTSKDIENRRWCIEYAKQILMLNHMVDVTPELLIETAKALHAFLVPDPTEGGVSEPLDAPIAIQEPQEQPPL